MFIDELSGWKYSWESWLCIVTDSFIARFYIDWFLSIFLSRLVSYSYGFKCTVYALNISCTEWYFHNFWLGGDIRDGLI